MRRSKYANCPTLASNDRKPDSDAAKTSSSPSATTTAIGGPRNLTVFSQSRGPCPCPNGRCAGIGRNFRHRENALAGFHFVAGTVGCRRNSSIKRQALIRKTQNGKATNTHEI